MTSMIDRKRITHRDVPADPAQPMTIEAGWNGQAGSYYFVVRWTKDVGHGTRAGDIYLDGGYPIDIFTDISQVAAMLHEVLDWSSPSLVGVFSDLRDDKTRDLYIDRVSYAPETFRHVPELMEKVMAGDETPVVHASTGSPSPARRWMTDSFRSAPEG